MLAKRRNFLQKAALKGCRCCSEIFPITETKIIRKKKPNKSDNLNSKKVLEVKNVSKEFRVNEVNIQMISKNIYEQLFTSASPALDAKTIESCQNNLLKHGINYKEHSHMPDVEIKLPKLEGKDVVEHFYNIGERQSAPYRELLRKLASSKLPPMPKKWSRAFGWSKYVGDVPHPVPCPPDDALVFDVEVLMSAGKRPTLACAVSTDAWYGWVSEPLANGDPHTHFSNINYHDLIPLETDGMKPCGDLQRPRIVIGHNVSYDRAKIKEQYWLQKTGVRFMDTMSMHTCVSGVTSYQRTVLKARNKEPHPSDDDWIEISALNNLSEVHKLYCGSPIDKQTRDVFVEGTMDDVHESFQDLMRYCAGDVVATHSVLRELLPLFLERFPHPVTLAGMLELGSAYLPVNSNWLQYIDAAETVFEDLKLESRQLLSQKADEACHMMANDAYKKDLWMWDQDWSTQKLKLKKIAKKKKDNTPFELETVEDLEKRTKSSKKEDFKLLNEEYIEYIKKKTQESETIEGVKELSKKFGYLYAMAESLPVRRPYLPGYPAWYRKLCTKPGKDPDWTPGANNITTSMQITPKLLRLSWEGYPLHYIQEEGWGFLVPFSRTQKETEGEPVLPLEELLAACPMAFCKQSDIEANVHLLPKTVEEDLGRRAYYARKKFDEQAAANQYHGLGVWCGVQIQGCCHFLRLPHKDGPKYKVGNPLAKDFLDMFSQNVLTAQGNEAEKVLTFGRMMSYWRNNRERIMSQQVVWLPQELLPAQLRGTRQYGAIVPQVVVCGTLTRSMSYWRNNRERIMSQQVVWLPQELLPAQLRGTRQYGAIVPQVVVCGTLTRRASEPTWMTASNAQAERVGSELRAMVQAPPGHKFVGADVDSQELWIAALLGDSSLGLCGGTAFGWAVLAGDKSTKTDLHSLTAAAAAISRDHAKVINYARIYALLGDSSLGLCGGTAFGWAVLAGDKSTKTDLHSLTAAAAAISRDHAKVINYARIYGAGQNFAERLLKQFNPTMTISEAKSKAAKMFTTTKGRRVYSLKKQYMEGFILDEDEESKVVEMAGYQAMRLAKMSGKRVEDMFERPKWVGGTESDMFNKLEEIAESEAPSTAFLSGRLSRALEHAHGRWGSTRLNWAVQSAAADFLHLMLASLAHLAPRARFCLSFHDEVRYLVPDEHKYEAALALQITNLLTRAFCSQRVGINDLPLSVAFFTSVEVDQVLRKEASLSCTTPSNPHGLDKGYGIPDGESLNIFEILDKCKSNIKVD